MTTYRPEALRTALESIGLQSGDVVLVHSSLLALGRMQGVSPAESVGQIYGLLRSVVGPTGTIVVPTFNFDFCNGAPFDRLKTPSKGMGSFSEYVRMRSDAIRSSHPMQSIAAIGPLADELCGRDTTSSFDPGGPFSLMLEYGGRGLLLGAPMQSFSLVHLAEERCRVPYRYWKDFSGPCGTPPVEKTYRMYVRDLNANPRLCLQKIEDALARSSLVQTHPIGAGAVKCFRLADFFAITMERLSANPNWVLQQSQS